MTFSELKEPICLYVGEIPTWRTGDKIVGISPEHGGSRYVRHDIRDKFPLPDSCVDRVESESVFEYIEEDSLITILNEIYRILKRGCLLRLSVPDYRGPIIFERCRKRNGVIFMDPVGGSGVRWFPVIETVMDICEASMFEKINYLHYYSISGVPVVKKIDHSMGMVRRTPDFDERVIKDRLPLSIVVDLIKQGN